MSGLTAFGGEVEAVFLDVGGVFHLPSHALVTAALRRAGFEADPDLLDRAHYAGVAALTVWPVGDDGIWTAYERAYVESLGAPAGSVPSAIAELDATFRGPGVWSRQAPGSLDALRRLQDSGVILAIVSNSDGTLEGRLRDEGICQVGAGRGVPM
ncbi:MAG TPA: hypothetical protein VGO87_05470, partial [Acidimicrobiia bacterium]